MEGLQEKLSAVKLENLGLDQKLSEKAAAEAALQEHQAQVRDHLDKKVAEFQQLMGIVNRLKADKEAQEGEQE